MGRIVLVAICVAGVALAIVAALMRFPIPATGYGRVDEWIAVVLIVLGIAWVIWTAVGDALVRRRLQDDASERERT